MMKNKVQILGAGLLALILAFTGCSNPLSAGPEASSPEAVSGGKIVIQLDGPNARTLGPTAEDAAKLKYRLVIQNSYKSIEEDIEDFSQPVERSFEAGSWTVGVWAYIDEYKSVAWGDEEVSLKDGETKNVALTLLPVTDQDAAGIFDYNISFPDPADDFNYADTTLTLTPQVPNSSTEYSIQINLRDNGKDADKLELPVGKYNLDITLESTRRVNNVPLKVIVKETVYLYPNLTTRAHYTFTEAHFGADVYLKGWASVANLTTVDEDGKPVHDYIPTEVQIKLYDAGGYYDETNIQTAPVTGGAWDLPVSSEEIGGPSNVSGVQLRLVVTSESGDETQTLTGPWGWYPLASRQGNTAVDLTATVVSIVKEDDDYFDAIEGVSNIAYDSDAIAGSYARLKIIPKDKYGVIGNVVSLSPSPWGGISRESDGTFGFTVPSSLVTVYAGFFHLKGTTHITSSNPLSYKPVKVEAYEEEPETYKWKLIGFTESVDADTGAWEIPVPAGYVYAGTGNIYFKVFSEAAEQPDQEYTINSFVYNLTGEDTVPLPVPLFTVSGVWTESTQTSVTIYWDAATWATGGYRIYRYNDGNDTYEPVKSLAATAVSYTDTGLTAGTSYDYAIVGLYGTPATEGDRWYFNAMTRLSAPQNVTAVTAANTNSPFRTYVSWDGVTNADYYRVYRDGSWIDEVYSPYYYDTSAKSLDVGYSYAIVAYSYSYGSSEYSAQSSPVYFGTTSYLSINSTSYGDIGASGEYDYYRFYVPDSTSYSFSFDEYGGLDVYGYIYVNGYHYSGFDSSFDGIYLNPGDEVMLAVRSYYSGGTGSYGVSVYYY
jgi:hypothetical protein